MTVFADSSAIVKLYADERGHEHIRAVPTYVISQLTRVEVPAALWRKQRIGDVDAVTAAVLVRAFEADYYQGADGESVDQLIPVALTASILDRAAALCGDHELQSLDAVQLASALAVADVDPDCDTVAAFDERLRTAAAAEGFALLPSTVER